MRAEEAARRLLHTRAITGLRPLSGGHVNASYLLETDSGPLVLQRINPAVFPSPEQVVNNSLSVWRHLTAARAAQSGIAMGWAFPEPLPTPDGAFSLGDEDRAHWRLLRHIAGRSLMTVESTAASRALGSCLAGLHMMLVGLPVHLCPDTLPGFHRLADYLAAYDQQSCAGIDQDSAVVWCQGQVDAGRAQAHIWLQAEEGGQLTRQIVHGDPKVANFLFAPEPSCEVAGFIDFDTVQSGLLLHDIGDCLRSVANPAGESSADPEVRVDLCLAMLDGYLAVASSLLADSDRALLAQSPWRMSYELGLRFLTDHLAGDRYFRVAARGDNLRRARGQLLLAQRLSALRESLATGVVRLLHRHGDCGHAF